MKQKNRLYGMVLCLIIVCISFIIWNISQDRAIQEIATLLVMFASGYALRETLDRIGERKNDRFL